MVGPSGVLQISTQASHLETIELEMVTGKPDQLPGDQRIEHHAILLQTRLHLDVVQVFKRK